MTLHFHWLHAPRWLANAHFNRALTLVLGIIGVSLLFSALRVVDAAVSGVVAHRAAAVAPAASGAPEMLIGTEPTSAGKPIDTDLDVPDSTVEAITL